MEFQVQIISHCPAFKNSFFALNFSQLIQGVVEVIQTVIVSILQNVECAGVVRYPSAHICSIDHAHFGVVTGADVIEGRIRSGIPDPSILSCFYSGHREQPGWILGAGICGGHLPLV